MIFFLPILISLPSFFVECLTVSPFSKILPLYVKLSRSIFKFCKGSSCKGKGSSCKGKGSS